MEMARGAFQWRSDLNDDLRKEKTVAVGAIQNSLVVNDKPKNYEGPNWVSHFLGCFGFS